MSAYDAALAAVAKLTAEERLRLIDELCHTLPIEEATVDDQEIERRVAELKSGTDQLETWQSIRTRLIGELGDEHGG